MKYNGEDAEIELEMANNDLGEVTQNTEIPIFITWDENFVIIALIGKDEFVYAEGVPIYVQYFAVKGESASWRIFTIDCMTSKWNVSI